MKPEKQSNLLLGITRSAAKMLEYGIPEEHRIKITQDPAKLFTISIGLLGDLAAAINREDSDTDSLAELKTNLLFSARFFDSYLQSKLNDVLDPYLVLLGSTSYYLCDLPGSASVLANQDIELATAEDPFLMGQFIRYLLAPHCFRPPLENSNGRAYGYVFDRYRKISEDYDLLFLGVGKFEVDFDAIRKRLLEWSNDIRWYSYEQGNSRQLLFSDLISAIISTKIKNSAWECLPKYTEIRIENWMPSISNPTFIKELWPAQHLLGEAGVLKGNSAVVQMPTSAGKTKATEIIIRSAFLASRASLAVIVAPFRALCHEIKDSLQSAFVDENIFVSEISDTFQMDFGLDIYLQLKNAGFDLGPRDENSHVLVITPEKLLYVLRHNPELALKIGLVIFDEGHQFDSGTRGINYELLLTSLKSMLPGGVQKVLISAVISNAGAVGEWLNGEPVVVDGAGLTPTFRSVGFASWIDRMGRIEYVDSSNVEIKEFFVPRVIERFTLERKPRELSDRFFPENELNTGGNPNPDFGKSVALYLGLKLAPNGGVAVFCGRKATAASMCDMAINAIERNVPLTFPVEYSDAKEVERLSYLHAKNLGSDASATLSAFHGIFSHHGNTPQGIRLAVEHAMRESLIRFVVCTSTLAQGVNLPIRYLIVTSVYQGREQIKVRDFHNLIGRAGRSGMHTEGSIIFADPVVYDKRKSRNDRWRWDQVKQLLDPSNSEPCISNLLSIFEPIKSDDKKKIITMEAMGFAKAYIKNPDEVTKLAARISTQHADKGFSLDGVERQIALKISLICAIESFLLSHWEESQDGLAEVDVVGLAESTLAFFLADDQRKGYIRELFQLLAKNIAENMTDPVLRKIYGRTLYGIQDARAIEEWVKDNADSLIATENEAAILELVWALLTQHINNGIFSKFDKPEVLKEITHAWISGQSFGDLLKIIFDRSAKMIWGTRRREFKIDHVVEIFEGTLAYEGSLLIGALCEFISNIEHDGIERLISRLQIFQKRLKYGLPNVTSVMLYELGFSDRVIAQELDLAIRPADGSNYDAIGHLQVFEAESIKVLDKYPAYFLQVYNSLV